MRNLNSNISNDNVFTEAGIKELNSLNQKKLFQGVYNGRKKRYESGQIAFRQGHLKRLNGIIFYEDKSKVV